VAASGGRGAGAASGRVVWTGAPGAFTGFTPQAAASKHEITSAKQRLAVAVMGASSPR
jgi:hypothetical protein